MYITAIEIVVDIVTDTMDSIFYFCRISFLCIIKDNLKVIKVDSPLVDSQGCIMSVVWVFEYNRFIGFGVNF